jgi:hypothetical protein
MNDDDTTLKAKSKMKDDTSDLVELKRDEIGKLLMLLSRAYTFNLVTSEQRRTIKGLICRRAGYLRLILHQEDIGVQLAALTTIGYNASSSTK